MKKLLCLLVASAVVASSAEGFDGNRKGFVVGGGVGFAPRVAWSISYLHETKAAFAGQFLIGYSWNQSNMIVWDVEPTIFDSDIVIRLHGGDNNRVGQVFDGVAWYHYFGRGYRTAFATMAFGRYRFAYRTEGDCIGPAIRIGVGYELVRHLQLGAYFTTGRTSNAGYTYQREQLTILASLVLY